MNSIVYLYIFECLGTLIYASVVYGRYRDLFLGKSAFWNILSRFSALFAICLLLLADEKWNYCLVNLLIFNLP